MGESPVFESTENYFDEEIGKNVTINRKEGESIKFLDNGDVQLNNLVYCAHRITYSTDEIKIGEKPAIRLIITCTMEGKTENTIDSYTFVSLKKFLIYDSKKKIIDNFLENIESWIKESKYQLGVRRARQEFQNDIIEPIKTPAGVLLAKNEFVVLCDPTSTFSQERTRTTAAAAGTTIRATKRVSFRVGGAAPIKEDYIARLDAGRLVLTNKKITFTGSSKTANIPLNKIVNLDRYSNAIGIAKDGNMRKFFFTDIEGDLWADAIEAIFRVNNSE